MNTIRTLGAGRPLRDAADHAPDARLRADRLVVLAIEGDALLLCQNHVNGERQATLQRHNVAGRDGSTSEIEMRNIRL